MRIQNEKSFIRHVNSTNFDIQFYQSSKSYFLSLDSGKLGKKIFHSVLRYLSPSMRLVSFYTPVNIIKASGFLIFSRGIKKTSAINGLKCCWGQFKMSQKIFNNTFQAL